MSVVKQALTELAKLSNPATDAAVVAVAGRLAPGVQIDTTQALEVLAVVGLLSGWIRRQISRRATTPVTTTTLTAPAPK